MKLKIVHTSLLTLCVLWMAVTTGAIPVVTSAGPDTDTSPAPSSDVGTPVLSSSGETLSPDEPPDRPAPAPETPAPSPEQTPEPPETAETSEETRETAPRIVTTTIRGDSLLDNDTYYDVDPQALLEEDFSFSLPGDGYQVLILHTHATESYTPGEGDSYEDSGEYRTTDPAYSVIRVGDELADALTASGLNVLHDTTLHDYPNYNGSYARCAETVEAYLAAYPTIRVVIDLHRDALGDEERSYRTLADIDGLEAAQLMFVMGTDVNLEHPQWRENLKLALTLQRLAEERYPTLMRPTILCDYRYNQQMSPGCLLLEVGTAANTLQEAITGVQLFGAIAGPYLASCIAE